jgi:hypothetical protein
MLLKILPFALYTRPPVSQLYSLGKDSIENIVPNSLFYCCARTVAAHVFIESLPSNGCLHQSSCHNMFLVWTRYSYSLTPPITLSHTTPQPNGQISRHFIPFPGDTIKTRSSYLLKKNILSFGCVTSDPWKPRQASVRKGAREEVNVRHFKNTL